MAGATYYKFNMELPMLWVNLKEFDNDRLAEIILSKGDEQDRKTNVKANMTKWRLDLEHTSEYRLDWSANNFFSVSLISINAMW